MENKPSEASQHPNSLKHFDFKVFDQRLKEMLDEASLRNDTVSLFQIEHLVDEIMGISAPNPTQITE